MDCSQTLYEFRAANPRALNVLEGSGVFATYQLQTNYRSNQEILDFANVTLADIEANQYANIRLRANSLVPVTSDSFKRKVKVKYTNVARQKDLDYKITEMLTSPDVKGYITDKFTNHEQVVFLAHRRCDIKIMQQTIEKLYPKAKCMNITSKRSYSSTYFSRYITYAQNDIKFFNLNCFSDMLMTDMINRICEVANCKTNTNIEHNTKIAISKWFTKNKNTIDMWVSQVQRGILTQDELLNNVKENLIHYEIETNAIKQALLNEQNRENKENQNTDDADFVFSTIHGAKGLEFKHAVILHHASNNQSEEDKRMYYVAFTRPQETEFILAYDSVKNPKIMADYKEVIEKLEANENAQATKI